MTTVEQRLDRLLDAVQAALGISDYTSLAKLSDDIAQEMDSLSGVADERALARLRKKAERNAACLIAAQRGFRAARRRIEDIRASGSGLVTYDGKGRRATVADAAKLTQRF